MTSFRKLVIGTNLVTFGLGILLVILIPPDSQFSVIGKVLVVVGIFANMYLALSVMSCGLMGARA